MSALVDFTAYPLSCVLKKLLKDKTTGKNIIFASDIYTGNPCDEISVKFLLSRKNEYELCPRVERDFNVQNDRIRKNAEVFTPSWVWNKMNNHCDSEWFGRENVFNFEFGESWVKSSENVIFPEGKNWQNYIVSKRLEITCGEAPYIVSRYDASTGAPIPIHDRVGILDRKIRIINENVKDEAEWVQWVYKAYENVYGYEYQGDNLLIARCNLVLTFSDYVEDRWKRKPTEDELNTIVKIINWNFWQMDGITGTVPCVKSMAINFSKEDDICRDIEVESIDCIIYDWEKKKRVRYREIH